MIEEEKKGHTIDVVIKTIPQFAIRVVMEFGCEMKLTKNLIRGEKIIHVVALGIGSLDLIKPKPYSRQITFHLVQY